RSPVQMKDCSGARSPRPASAQTASWPSRETAAPSSAIAIAKTRSEALQALLEFLENPSSPQPQVSSRAMGEGPRMEMGTPRPGDWTVQNQSPKLGDLYNFLCYRLKVRGIMVSWIEDGRRTPMTDEDHGEPNEELVEVFDTKQESEAMVIGGLLESAGIESTV